MPKPIGKILIAGALLLCAAALGAEPPALRDQFGATGGLADALGEVQLAIVVSAKRLRRIRAWEEAIRTRYPSLPILRVADVPRTAPADYADVAAKLRKRLPEDVNVLIDLEGSWVAAFPIDERVPALLLFDAHGVLVANHQGMYEPALFEALAVDIDRALAQSP